MKRNWWVRWFGCYETMGAFTLYTPWWQSGISEDAEGREQQIFCCALWAEDEAEIESILYGCYDTPPEPGSIEISTMQLCADDWDPSINESGRFPWADWMTPYWARGEYRQED